MNLPAIKNLFFDAVLAVQGIFLFLCLLRSILGPRVSDRLVAVNMMGTNIISIIAILAIRLGESYLCDISLIYAAVSFLAVVIRTKVYTGAYMERRASREAGKENEPT